MSELKTIGKIIVINETETFDSGFMKRAFVIETDEQYPQQVKFEMLKEKTALLDNYKVGDSVEVSFNIRGNEYNGKYYVNLQSWKIQEISQQNNQTETEKTVEEVEDDLPF
jgi:hypothetical protein